VDQPTVLIISEDAEFSRAVTGAWQGERDVPAFTLMSGDLCHGLDPDGFALAVVGGLRRGALFAVLPVLESSGKTILVIAEDAATVHAIRDSHPRVQVLRRYEGWLEATLLLGAEILRRTEAAARARKAQRVAAAQERHATLGRYMLEMRHSLNNALTSVLGNAELLLLEPGVLSAAPRAQIETVRNMAVRMHEIFQRFSSLETELRLLEPPAESEEQVRRHAAAASQAS
jgi:signal transduction histidine kinase